MRIAHKISILLTFIPILKEHRSFKTIHCAALRKKEVFSRTENNPAVITVA